MMGCASVVVHPFGGYGMESPKKQNMFELYIDLSNDAFSYGVAGYQVAHMLDSIAQQLRAGETTGTAREDGNIVGHWLLVREPRHD